VGHKKSKKAFDREHKKVVPKQEDRGWIFLMVSSKWFIVVVLLLAGIVWYGFYLTHTKEVSGSDDREYASIARNIVNGKGITRNFIYPVDINFFEKLPVPEFVHPPGYPLILAGFFKLFGISDFVALLPSYLSYFILIVLLFFFVRRYSDVRTSAVAVLILIFNREILDMSLIALSEEIYTLLFFLFFILFLEAKSPRAIFVTGVLLGMSHLIRENMYPFLIPIFIYLYFYPDLPLWGKMGFFVTGLLIPIVPNMIRSFLETGSPFFSYGKFTFMAFTDKYPWLNIYRDIQNPSLFEFLMNDPSQFILKYISNLVSTLEQIMSVSNPYLLALFFIEMFNWKISPEWKRIKMLFLLLFISQILFIPLFTFTNRFFIPFLPLMIAFASQSFLRISEGLISEVKAQWKKRISFLITFLFLIFFVIPATYTMVIKPGGVPVLGFKTPQFGFLLPKEEAEGLNDFLRNEVKDNQVIWSDLAETLEWEGNRFCGWLPTRIRSIYEIHKKIPVDGILLTSLRTPYKMEEEWRYLLFSESTLPKYRTVKLYKGRSISAKLLIRDERD